MARRNPPSGEGRIAAEMAQLARAEARTRPSADVAPSVSGGLSWTPAGGGQFIGGGPSNVPGGTSQPGAPAPAPTGPTGPTQSPTPATTPASTGGMSEAERARLRALEDQLRALQDQRDEERRQAREGAGAFLQGILNQYGLGSLSGEIESLINQWGTNVNVISERLRQTEPYKVRFKGLLGLQQRGVADVRNEAEYLNLETQYRQAFREAGLRDYLGQSGTQAEYDAIARLVGDFSLSVNEVRDRITDAQRVVAETPQEVRDSLQRFYNVDPATLTSYVLDPQRTTGEIQRRANAAIVGGYAQRAGLEFGAGVSERIGEFLGGERDIMGTQIEPQLADIARTQRTTERLAQIEQGTLTAEETALSQLDLDEEARRKVRGLQSRERARFGGTAGGITSGTLARTPGI